MARRRELTATASRQVDNVVDAIEAFIQARIQCTRNGGDPLWANLCAVNETREALSEALREIVVNG